MSRDALPDVASIQVAWKKAVAQLAEVPPGSPENDRLSERVHDLAAAYRAALEAHARVRGKSEPEPAPAVNPEATNWSHTKPRDED